MPQSKTLERLKGVAIVSKALISLIILFAIGDIVIMYEAYTTEQEWWLVPLVLVPIQYLIVNDIRNQSNAPK